jgi:hypothetical protein
VQIQEVNGEYAITGLSAEQLREIAVCIQQVDAEFGVDHDIGALPDMIYQEL